ncbi:MAG: response regulator [Desulfuromonadaceae bacterium]
MNPEDQDAAHPGGRKPVILVVDDDANNLALVRDCLTGFNYTVLVAEDGECAVSRADYARPDLILLDIMMPGMDGFETCRLLKRQKSSRDIPVIFMSALAGTGHKVLGLEAGAVDYVTKPFQQEELLARVGVHLSIRDLNRRLKEANELLETRVEARTQDLAIANRVLEEGVAERRTMRREVQEERRKLMAKLIQTNRMTSLGLLISSISHNINTPNGAIKLAAQHLAGSWKDALPILEQVTKEEGDFTLGGLPFGVAKGEIRGAADSILNNADRVERVIQDLRAYNVGERNELRPGVSINRVVEEALTIIRAHGRQGEITITPALAPNIPTITGNQYQLEQVVVNLLLNAMQAMPDNRGTVTVRTEYSAETAEVGIIVTDQGEGIGPEVRKHLFEAFFSTRIDKGGSGLGLYISNFIVSEHKGRLTIESEQNAGTVATVHIPVATADSAV